MNWKYENKEIVDLPTGCVGFIYYLKLNNGKEYIGKKQSGTYPNWVNYYSSSDEIKQYIKEYGKESIERVILKYCYTKINLSYWEEYYLFITNAIINPNYINKSIGGRYFRGKIT